VLGGGVDGLQRARPGTLAGVGHETPFGSFELPDPYPHKLDAEAVTLTVTEDDVLVEYTTNAGEEVTVRYRIVGVVAD
jgi:hypothetical protein